MMLYPTTIVNDLAAIEGMSAVASSSSIVCPITIAAQTGILLSMVQLAPTQDYSLRAWVSYQPGGQFLPTISSYWHLNRHNDQMIFVYDMNSPIPNTLCNVHAIPLPAGNYTLNILNLVNAENVFSFSSTAIQC